MDVGVGLWVELWDYGCMCRIVGVCLGVRVWLCVGLGGGCRRVIV